MLAVELRDLLHVSRERTPRVTPTPVVASVGRSVGRWFPFRIEPQGSEGTKKRILTRTAEAEMGRAIENVFNFVPVAASSRGMPTSNKRPASHSDE